MFFPQLFLYLREFFFQKSAACTFICVYELAYFRIGVGLEKYMHMVFIVIPFFKGDIVISTIQKLFCVLTGQKINDSDEDAEDEKAKADEEKDSKTVVDLGNDLKLPPDYFQLIMVDECHRSIYGKWKKVLDYFSGVTVLGLTATPTPEAYAYFNKNVIEEYTYDDSVVDGVNVPPRVYRIITDITAHGGTIEKGTKITETSKRTGKSEIIDAGTSVEYGASELDRSVVNKKQIKEVLMA